MPSLIDPSHPADGIPASKAQLRANLAAAKAEIEALQAALGGGAVTATPAGNVLTLDWSLASMFIATLNQTVTSVVIDNRPASGSMLICLKQDSTGNRQLSGWPAEVKWADGGGEPLLTLTPNAIDVISILKFGDSTLLAGRSQGYI